MTLLRRNRRVLFLWLLGLVAVYLITPVGPRDGWQPAEGEKVLGFHEQGTKQGTTLITCSRFGRDDSFPICIKDADTGLILHKFGPDYKRFQYRGISIRTGLVFIEDERDPFRDVLDTDSKENELPHTPWELHCIDVLSGKDRFTFRVGTFRFNSTLFFQGSNWAVSANAETTAFISESEDRKGNHLEWRDLRDGEMILQLDGASGIELSPDGRYLGRTCRNGFEIWDRTTKQRVAEYVDQTKGDFRPPSLGEMLGIFEGPNLFSADGRFIRMKGGLIWEWARGQQGMIDGLSCQFAERSIFAPNDSLLYCLEKTTEEAAPRIQVFDLVDKNHALRFQTSVHGENSIDSLMGLRFLDDSNLAVELPSSKGHDPSRLDRLLSAIPGLEYRIKERISVRTIVFDASTMTESGRFDGNVVSISLNRGLAITCSCDGRNAYSIWDFPPRKPLRWLLPALAAWSAVFWACVLSLRFLAARRRRRRLELG